MICEITNALVRLDMYVYGADEGVDMTSNSYSVFGVLMQVIMSCVTISFLAWWIIPLRKLGAFSKRFKCDRKE